MTLFNNKEVDVIDKSLDHTINSDNGDYIMQYIRDNYLSDSTVTVFVIGSHSSENEGDDWEGPKNYFIQRELQASLYNGENNSRSGIVGVVLPSMYDNIFKGTFSCSQCGGNHNSVSIEDSSVIREYSYNYYVIPHTGCAWSDSDRYCILVKWEDFIKNPETYIDQAYDKRFSDVSKRIRIRGLR